MRELTPEFEFHYEAPVACIDSIGFAGPTVEEARKAYKAALKRDKAARKRLKAHRKVEKQRAKDRALGLATLRAIANDDRKYSADARIEAARSLLARV